MGYFDKVRKKEAAKKLAQQVMNTPEYKEAIRSHEEQAVLNALGRFSFMMCSFLETRHGYKSVGLKKFLKFVLDSLQETEGNSDFFIEYDKYFKEAYELDVLAELGMGLEVE